MWASIKKDSEAVLWIVAQMLIMSGGSVLKISSQPVNLKLDITKLSCLTLKLRKNTQTHHLENQYCQFSNFFFFFWGFSKSWNAYSLRAFQSPADITGITALHPTVVLYLLNLWNTKLYEASPVTEEWNIAVTFSRKTNWQRVNMHMAVIWYDSRTCENKKGCNISVVGWEMALFDRTSWGTSKKRLLCLSNYHQIINKIFKRLKGKSRMWWDMA